MAKRIHKSSGGGDFRLTIDTHDLTDEVTQALRLALHRALTRIGLECEAYAKKLCHVRTGRLHNSITHYVDGDSVYVGTNEEYAPSVEFGTRNEAKYFYRH